LIIIDITKIALIKAVYNKLYSKLLTNQLFKSFLLIVLLMVIVTTISAQDTVINISSDTLGINSVMPEPDTAIITPQSSAKVLSSLVEYSSFDSIRFDVQKQKVYLFGRAEITMSQ